MTVPQSDASSRPLEDTKILTSRDVAALYGVAPKTVTRWAESGALPADFRTPGNHRRWYAASVPAYQLAMRHREGQQ